MSSGTEPHPLSRANNCPFEFVPNECQEDFDQRFYEAALDRNPTNVDVLRQLVDIMASSGNYARALTLDEQLVALRPNDCFAKYNLACSLSVLGRPKAALTALDEALQLGYDDFAHMDSDSDLDPLRNHDGYFELLQRHGLVG